MGILQNKFILITGVLTDQSIAYYVAKRCLEEGAEIALTGFGRSLSLTNRVAKKLGRDIAIFEMDATSESDICELSEELMKKWGRLDGLLHAIAYAPPPCLGSGMFVATGEDVKTAFEISTFTLALLAKGFKTLMRLSRCPSIVGLDFDASKAWPVYDWMGVNKAALESLCRYLARDLGPDQIRINLVAAGPLKTMAAKSIPGFSQFEKNFCEKAPLGWTTSDHDAVAQACALLFSDYLTKTTGEILHVDGGVHAVN